MVNGSNLSPRPLGTGLSLGLHAVVLLTLISATAVPGKPGPPDTLAIDIVQTTSPQSTLEEEPRSEPEPPKPEPAPPSPAPAPKPHHPRQPTKPAPPLSEPAVTPEPSPTDQAPQAAAVIATPAPPPRQGGGDTPDDSLALYGRIVWAKIAAHKPRGVRLPGTATITFALAPDGSLISAEVTASNGAASLDRVALATIREAAPFPQPPPHATAAQLTFSVPFQFR